MQACKFEWVETSEKRFSRVCTLTDLEHLKAKHPHMVEADHNVIVRDPNKHDAQRQYRLYGAETYEVNEDMQHPVAAKEWPGYITQGERQGPRPFSTMRERRDYCARYGFEEM